jgi:uncharacterized membrane protein
MHGPSADRLKTNSILVFFALVLALISFPNHALFRTYALDLGLYTHAMWHYAHGRIHDSTLFLGSPQPILADHFDLYLPLFSPLIFLLGSWTLLIIQWLAILFGAIGLHRVLLSMGLPARLADLGMVVMLLYFGLFAAMAFDYHSNVVAAMVLPWFLLALLETRRARAALLFLFMLMGKENMGLWLGPLALLLSIGPVLPKGMRAYSVLLGLTGLVWSVVVVGWIMPALSASGDYAHFDYQILGGSASAMPKALWDSPLHILSAMFTDHMGVRSGTAIKLEFWWMMLLAGGWALVRMPLWGMMALPLIAQKMLHDDPGKWSVIAHYGVEFAPLLGIAVPLALQRHAKSRVGHYLPWITVALSLGATIHFMDMTVAYHDRSRIRIYQTIHYTKAYDHRLVRRTIGEIPRSAAVSAQSPAVPHLALRDRLYQFPIVQDAEYILLLPLESPYPLDTSAYRAEVGRIMEDPGWTKIVDYEEVLLFRREQTEGPITPSAIPTR